MIKEENLENLTNLARIYLGYDKEGPAMAKKEKDLKIEEFVDKILWDKISNDKWKSLDDLMSDLVKNSDEKERRELESLLEIWKTRLLFIGALREAKDEEEKQEKEIIQKIQKAKTGEPITLTGYGAIGPDRQDDGKRFVRKEDAEVHLRKRQDNDW